MDEPALTISRIAASTRGRTEKARAIAAVIRSSGAYRWVGIYAVSPREISVVGWDGPGAPAHPRFPRDRGLCGAAVASGETVIVDDVVADPRYLTTFGSTRSEMVVPIREGGDVVGLIDVESDRVAAFDERDHTAVERLAGAVAAFLRGAH
jgi:GAF domain-containing protein